MEDNVAAVLHGPRDVKIESWPVEDPKPGEIQARVHSVGVCGTDIRYWKSGALLNQPLTEPMVLGHETAAEVIKVGPGVDNFKPGDRVHLHPRPACHRCFCCVAGKAHNCQAVKPGTLVHGHIRRICNHPAEYTFIIPSEFSMDEGALIEPWVVGVYAVEKSGLTLGDKCVIVGAGALGIMIYLAAKIAGAVDICMVDISEAKLKLTQTVGECKTVLACKDPRETAKKIEEVLGGKPDVAFDASCTPSGITTAIYCAKPCGRVMLAGMAPDNCTLPMQHAAINEIDILSVVRYGTCYPRAMEMLKAGKVDLKQLVAARFPLREANEALKATASGLTTGFKSMSHTPDELFDVEKIMNVVKFDDPDNQDEGWLMSVSRKTCRRSVFPENFTRNIIAKKTLDI